METTKLRWVAIITMLIDHFGLVFLEPSSTAYLVCRIVGRFSFPIFAFLVSEGFVHTKNIKKYGLRLLLFAVLSEIPFDLMTSGRLMALEHQNVLFTFVLALLALYEAERVKQAGVGSISIVIYFGIALLAEVVGVDYGLMGILLVVIFYHASIQQKKRWHWPFAYLLLSGGIQSVSAFAVLLLRCYNGKKGECPLARFFYYIYPVHMLLFAGIKLWIG